MISDRRTITVDGRDAELLFGVGDEPGEHGWRVSIDGSIRCGLFGYDEYDEAVAYARDLLGQDRRQAA